MGLQYMPGGDQEVFAAQQEKRAATGLDGLPVLFGQDRLAHGEGEVCLFGAAKRAGKRWRGGTNDIGRSFLQSAWS
ncbi:hypothetical protein P4161_03595 [Pseudomonas aeruginosa]|nr:hypothetical protein [Pseudomonas aeruginosa]